MSTKKPSMKTAVNTTSKSSSKSSKNREPKNNRKKHLMHKLDTNVKQLFEQCKNGAKVDTSLLDFPTTKELKALATKSTTTLLFVVYILSEGHEHGVYGDITFKAFVEKYIPNCEYTHAVKLRQAVNVHLNVCPELEIGSVKEGVLRKLVNKDSTFQKKCWKNVVKKCGSWKNVTGPEMNKTIKELEVVAHSKTPSVKSKGNNVVALETKRQSKESLVKAKKSDIQALEKSLLNVSKGFNNLPEKDFIKQVLAIVTPMVQKIADQSLQAKSMSKYRQRA